MSADRVELLAWLARVEARRGSQSLFEVLEVTPAADEGELRAAFVRLAGLAHPDLHRRSLGPVETERLVRAYARVSLAYATLRDPDRRARYERELAERARRPSSNLTSSALAVPRTRTGEGPPPGTRPTSPPPRRKTSPPLAPPTSPPPGTRATMPPPAATTVPPPAAAPRPTRPPASPTPSRISASTVGTQSPPSRALRPSAGTRDPATAQARAQTYYRKGEAAWRAGDLGAAVFNLRLAAAADPTAEAVRAALAQVEAELAGRR